MQERPRVIGFAGRANVGKSTAARFLKTRFEERKMEAVIRSIATPLKEAARVLGFTDQELREKTESARHFLQELGALIRRLKPHFLIAKVLEEPEGGTGVVIIDDVRLEEEVRAIQRQGGVVVKVEREVEWVNRDRTETEIEEVPESEFDMILRNDGTLEELESKVINLHHRFYF